jgi:hypothetical protein
VIGFILKTLFTIGWGSAFYNLFLCKKCFYIERVGVSLMERDQWRKRMERDRWRERMERDQWREGGWEIDVEVDEAISMERGGWRGSGWREWMK